MKSRGACLGKRPAIIRGDDKERVVPHALGLERADDGRQQPVQVADHRSIVAPHLDVNALELCEVSCWHFVRLMYGVRGPEEEERLRGVVRGDDVHEPRMKLVVLPRAVRAALRRLRASPRVILTLGRVARVPQIGQRWVARRVQARGRELLAPVVVGGVHVGQRAVVATPVRDMVGRRMAAMPFPSSMRRITCLFEFGGDASHVSRNPHKAAHRVGRVVQVQARIEHRHMNRITPSLYGCARWPTKLVAVHSVEQHTLGSKRGEIWRRKLVVARPASRTVRRPVRPTPVVHNKIYDRRRR